MALSPGCIIGNQKVRYRIRKPLGLGSFGQVYEAEAIFTGQTVAVKVQDAAFDHDMLCSLDYESTVLRQLREIDGVPNLIICGVDEQNGLKFVATNLLKCNLNHVLRNLGGRFSLQTTLRMAVKLLKILEEVHSRGFIHRDIKQSNIMLGGDESPEEIFLIDYGLAKQFMDLETMEHFHFYDGIGGLGGNWWTSSVNARRGYAQSRRDDLLSLGYNLVIFLTGNLPRFGFQNEPKPEKYEKVGKMKEAYTPELLCDGLPQEFITYFEHCSSLQFNQTPDYQYLRGIFKNLFRRLNGNESFSYDWNSVVETETLPDPGSIALSEASSPHSPIQGKRFHNESSEEAINKSGIFHESSSEDIDKSTKDAKTICTVSEPSESSQQNSVSSSPFTPEQNNEDFKNLEDKSRLRIEGPMPIPGTLNVLFIQYDGDEVKGFFQGVKVPFYGNGGSSNNQGSNEDTFASASAKSSKLWIKGPINLPETTLSIFMYYLGDQPIGLYVARKVAFKRCDHEDFSSNNSSSDSSSSVAGDESQQNRSFSNAPEELNVGSQDSDSSDSTSNFRLSSTLALSVHPQQDPTNVESCSTTVSVFLDERDEETCSSVFGSNSVLNLGFCQSTVVTEERESTDGESCSECE